MAEWFNKAHDWKNAKNFFWVLALLSGRTSFAQKPHLTLHRHLYFQHIINLGVIEPKLVVFTAGVGCRLRPCLGWTLFLRKKPPSDFYLSFMVFGRRLQDVLLRANGAFKAWMAQVFLTLFVSAFFVSKDVIQRLLKDLSDLKRHL